MKTKFLLTLLTLNGLFFGANIASASTVSPTENSQNIANLSRTISKSIDLSSDYHALIELAIDRALLAQKDTNTQDRPTLAGDISIGQLPIINGKVAQPNPNQSNPPVLINGIIKKVEPQDRQTERRRPKMINGVIVQPDRQK
jgi:hypothetical protein